MSEGGLCKAQRVPRFLKTAAPPHTPHPAQTGVVYAVEFSHRSGRDLINMAKTRPNIVPIVEDARHPLKDRMLIGIVDTVFADVAQPDQVRGGEGAPCVHTCPKRPRLCRPVSLR